MKELENIFKCLADKNRLRILKLLEQKKMCVCELSFILGIKQPSVSRHLKKLNQANLITGEQNGFWTDYLITNRRNKYIKTLLKNFENWLNDDKIVIADLKKSKKADRNKICCGEG